MFSFIFVDVTHRNGDALHCNRTSPDSPFWVLLCSERTVVSADLHCV